MAVCATDFKAVQTLIVIPGDTRDETGHSKAGRLMLDLSTTSSTPMTAAPPETAVFDNEIFFMEVRKCRCLWDAKSESYKNRTKKQNAWAKIADVFDRDGKILSDIAYVSRLALFYLQYPFEWVLKI